MSPILIAVLVLGATPADTLPVPHAYLDALAVGTRSRTGAPGPAYWQQQVDYSIRTTLDPAGARVSGVENIRYQNNSPNTVGEIWLNLPQNVFASGNPRNREAPITGGFTLSRIVVQGQDMTIARAGESLSTIVGMRLPRPIPSGESVELEIEWSFEVPEGAFRMGREGNEVFYLAQWYPQVAVYDDVRGWARDPYLGAGEFYLEYGDYDVQITVPAGWLVGASGVLQNASEVLTAGAVRRLGALSRSSVTRVVTENDREGGRATAAGGADGTLTWHYIAENVRDFAWGASDRYVWDATVAEYPGRAGSRASTDIHVLYRPGEASWGRGAEYARHSIESHSNWYPYPYPQMTVNEGVIGGGMEYPMITIIGGGRTPMSLYSVVSHELAHMWWPMVVGTNERLFAWMDEGLATFSEDMFIGEVFPTAAGAVGSQNAYLQVAGSDQETESMRPADLFGPAGNRGVASYSKPATVFHALRTILGAGVFDASLRAYTERWAFRHPHPLDLFWTFEDVSGQDLDWFFYPWMYTTGVMDQAVSEVRVGDGAVTVVVSDLGEIPMPVRMRVELGDGTTLDLVQPVSEWVDGTMEVRIPLASWATSVTLDPGRDFPDADRSNDRWIAPTR